MAITAPLLWLDGEMVASSDANIPLMGHAAQRGSLVFDVGAFHLTPRGPALFRARDHVARFKRSAQIVGVDLPFDDEALVRAAMNVVAANDATKAADGLIRWSVFYAAAEADLIPRDAKTHVAVAAQSLQDPPQRPPIRVAIFDNARKAPPEVLAVDVKAAASYLGPMIARRRAISVGADDVVLLDREGAIAEAPIANVFAVVEGTLWTPALGRILPGITRDTVLTIAKTMGIPIREARVEVDLLNSADEAFLTATSLPIGPIGSINGKKLGGAPGPITRRLMDCILSVRRGNDPERDAWLTYT